MNTFHIHINGIVQGVGFRPMIYQLATRSDLKGYVKNGSDGVHIFFNASEEKANAFLRTIKEKAPAQSKIISAQLNQTEDKDFGKFSILIEEDNNVKKVLLSPDKALCIECRNELHDMDNRRYRYPFITCTQCGPRYSIINRLPYERVNTSMQPFEMCAGCKEEYDTVTDRRFFSQTNSCAECGIELSFYKDRSTVVSESTEVILMQIKKLLEEGKIIALKGIGGYLLVCAADSAESIQLLRNRKHRPAKPFAVLYPDLETVSYNFELNEGEKRLLLSEEAPVVLLYPKQPAFTNLAINDIAPGLKRLGVMLPYSPLLELVAKDYGMPLVATSANISGSPIIYKDEDAPDHLFNVADFIISYNRNIVIPLDDSVGQVSKNSGHHIILRRSRGYAPSFLNYIPDKNVCVLSTGAFLKSSFTLSVNGNVFISQFLGSGESYESQQMYKATLDHWLDLYDVKPDVIITDKHPDYFSHQYANELAEKFGISVNFVQHHQAHFAAVLAENNLLQTDDAVMGVIWDGTGLGDDGHTWGGEFFKYENKEMLRCYHFDYFPAVAGDKLALEPRIAAMCVSAESWPQPESLKEKFTEIEWNNYQLLISNTRHYSSSAGRIFDAVASLLNICDKQSYEGEAAMYLQAIAEDYVEKNGFAMEESYFREDAPYNRIPTSSLLQGINQDIKNGKPVNYIAARFHYSLVCLIGFVAGYAQVQHICFSGGVFQNALLVDWIAHVYKNKYQIYFHKNLSPNDENISFGQLVYYDKNIKSITKSEMISSEEEAVKSYAHLKMIGEKDKLVELTQINHQPDL